MPAAAKGSARDVSVPPLAVVAMLIALPLAVPFSWLVGLLALVVERPRGWRLTVALSPGGLFLPLWLYGHTPELGWAGYPLAAATVLGCLLATHRILCR
jgi:hypothetical protein